MPIFSLVVLALYVFLQSAPVFEWFAVDPKLTGFVGIAFVLAVVIDLVLSRGTWLPQLRRVGKSE